MQNHHKKTSWGTMAKSLKKFLEKKSIETMEQYKENCDMVETRRLDRTLKKDLENIKRINAKTLKAFMLHHGFKEPTDFINAIDFTLSLLAFGSDYLRPWNQLRGLDFEGSIAINGATLNFKAFEELKKGVA